MDLVDIDKVLDNLELNEEEHKDGNPTIKQPQNLNSTHLHPGDIMPMSVNEAAQNKSNYYSATPNLTGDRGNKFVGVSQVFNSLDEYRKNVETLEAGIHLYRNSESKNNDTNDETKNHKPVAEDHANTTCINQGEEDPYADDEINKFISTDEEHGFSSNSITTSSSSTFSSGPSPALLSTESESSFEDKLVDRSVLLIPKSDAQSKRIDDELQLESNIKTDCNKELQRSEFDDLAVGLSSISLTNQGSPLSSEMASSKYILKMDNLSSSLSLSTKNYLNSEGLLEPAKVDTNHSQEHIDSSLKLDNSQSDKIDKISTVPHATSHQNVMVTFGSTMDEISDTELDSILQEIDAEMPSQTYPEIINPDPGQSGTTELLKKKCKIDRKVNIMSIEDNILTPAFSPNVPSGQKCNDAMNIDSFSQASTIEFAEDRTYEDDIYNCRGIEEIREYSEGQKNKQSIAQKRQRPTTLDLPVRKINLYATAGQTPPGSRIYDQTTSSSEEDTPEDRADLPRNDEKTNLNDAAGHTPPERSDRSIVGTSFTETEIGNSASNYDVSMGISDNAETENEISSQSLSSNMNPNLGKVPPIWVPDHEANACMQCQHKFTLLKRRHHCRACGQVLCSVCCSQKFKLEFLSNPESRVCVQCFLILTKLQQQMEPQPSTVSATSPPLLRTPNPNNPMEYCSTIPPHRQVNPQTMSYPTVIVPVGVLKKEGNLKKSRKRKSVMFSDGIRPGSDLANLDGKWSDAKHARKSLTSDHLTTENAGSIPNIGNGKIVTRNNTKTMVMLDGNDSFIPKGENSLPPIKISNKSDPVYQEVPNNADLIKRLHSESLKFVVQTNFYVFVKISHLKCCINKTVINFTTCGLHHVGNDEIIILLELDNSNEIPKDIFIHLNEIYSEASKGHPITELGFSMPKDLLFLGSREHGGFLFIRSTFQCLQDVHVPNSPFLIGVLIHRWEVPWAKIFPLRLMLRLGAQYRYYPSPHISVREREPVYAEIAQTIINLLADFRNYSYTLPTIKGMYIHMEDRRTNILIPRNRHDEVIKAINNSSDHILAMAANFSKKADGHLVCIQNIKAETMDSHSYSTQAINIQGQPRKVTGASFFVLNEALKSTSGLSGKCSIIEDGLMVQILPTKMIEIRNALINMTDIDIVCGPIEAGEQQTEVVYIQWVDDDIEINIGVRSPIDSREMDGIPSIRVHSGVNLSNTNHILKWTEVFIIEISGDESPQCKAAFDISKASEQIARNTSIALLPFLDLLAANGNVKIGLRVTLNQDNVCYEAGSQNERLPPLYMNALDDELIPTLHKEASELGKTIVLELVFYILNV